jgi:hypothetical protein
MVGESPHLSMYTRSFSYTGRKNLAHLHTTCAHVHTRVHTQHTRFRYIYVCVRNMGGTRHRRTDPVPPTPQCRSAQGPTT